MKKYFLAIIILIGFVSAEVKAQLPDHTPLMNKYWDLLSTRTIKKNTKTGLYEPFFPPPLVAINNTVITLQGYMVPLKTAAMHQTFLLSVLPVMQCQFCGEGDIPEMVEIFMDKPIKFHKKPITIEGRLKISDDADGSTFQLFKSNLK